jgi:hypothetical protein
MISEIAADRFRPSADRNDVSIATDNATTQTQNQTINLNRAINKSHSIIKPDNSSETEEQQENITPPKENPIPTPKPNIKDNQNFKIVKANDIKPVSNNAPTNNPKPKKEVSNNTDKASEQQKDFSQVVVAIGKQDYNSAIKQINQKLKSTKDPEVVAHCNY